MPPSHGTSLIFLPPCLPRPCYGTCLGSHKSYCLLNHTPQKKQRTYAVPPSTKDVKGAISSAQWHCGLPTAWEVFSDMRAEAWEARVPVPKDPVLTYKTYVRPGLLDMHTRPCNDLPYSSAASGGASPASSASISFEC